MIRESLEIQMTAEKVIGIENITEVVQGSEEWFLCKLGVLSASNAKIITMGKKSKTFRTYIYKKIGEIIAPEIDDREINSPALNWGRENEEAARTAYELITGVKTKRVGFFFKDSSLRVGCSPDAIMGDEGLEIKAPTSGVFAMSLLAGEIKEEWIWQAQFSMFVTGTEAWQIAIFDPRAIKEKMVIKRFKRDNSIQERIEESVEQAIEIMDEALERGGYRFFDQWADRVTVAQR